MTNPTSAAERELGIVTPNIIIDRLDGYEVLATPAKMNHRLEWCAVLGASPEANIDPNHLLILLRSEMLRTKNIVPEKAIALLVLRADEPFDSAYASMSRDLISRTIVAREPAQGKSFNILQSELLSFFFRIHCWKVRCDEILRSGGSMQSFIDETEKYTRNWIDVTDGTYSLLAYTRKCDPPGSLSKDLVELGCHSFSHLSDARGMGAFKEWRDQTSIEQYAPAEYTPYDHMTAVLKIKGDYYGHVVMVCNNRPLTPGLVDFFANISGYCQDIIERDSKKSVNTLSAHQNFLENLLSGKSLSQDYINTQCAFLGLDGCTFFRLMTVDYHESEFSNQPLFLMNVLNNQFPKALAMLYEGDILLLFCEKKYDPAYDAQRTALMSEFCSAYGCISYSSGHARSINDISLLHAQARLTAQYQSCIDSEKQPLLPNMQINCYIFEEAFNYYCCDFGRKDDALLAFCLSNTLLDLVIDQAQDRDVSDTKLLYCYLCNERKATPTAELLHMHRNNVLYRIGNIEKRFHFDLNSYGLRQYLLNCYRIKIQSSATFRRQLQS